LPHRPHLGFGLRFFKKDGKEDEEAIFETRASHGASDEEGSQDLSDLRLAKQPSKNCCPSQASSMISFHVCSGLTDTNGNLTHAPSLATEVTPRGEPGGWTA